MMSEEEAKRVFANVIGHECPECKAAPGELCRSGGVWVHLDRMTVLAASP